MLSVKILNFNYETRHDVANEDDTRRICEIAGFAGVIEYGEPVFLTPLYRELSISDISLCLQLILCHRAGVVVTLCLWAMQF